MAIDKTKNKIIKDLKIDAEDYGYYSHKYNYKVVMEVFFDTKDCYPEERSETKIKEITDLADKYFENELHFKWFVTKTFNDEKELYDFIEKKKKGQENLKEMLSQIDEKINIEQQEKSRINELELQVENERQESENLKTEIINRIDLMLYKINEINEWADELTDYRNLLQHKNTEDDFSPEFNSFSGGKDEKINFVR